MTTQQKTNAITLDPFTLKILTNFATINGGLIIKSGSEIRTMSESKSILAEATVPDYFPVDFAIADVRQFLNLMGSLFDKPQIAFFDKYLQLVSGSELTKIYYTNPDLIAYPSKRIVMPTEDVTCILTSDILQKILKSSSILGVSTLSITSTDNSNVVRIKVCDNSFDTSNTWEASVPGTYTSPFNAVLMIDNLKLVEGDYSVSISSKGICSFKHNNRDVQYFIAVENVSKF